MPHRLEPVHASCRCSSRPIHGAWSVSVWRNISSFAVGVVVPFVERGQVHRRQLPLPERVDLPDREPGALLRRRHREPELDEMDPVRQTAFCSNSGAWRRIRRTAPACRSPSPVRRPPGCTRTGRTARSLLPRAGGRRSAGNTIACFPVSVGFSRATTRAPRGLRCSMNRLMVPPLPAASRPSNTIDVPAARVVLHPLLELEQLDLQEPLDPLVVGAGHPLVVGVSLAPRVDELPSRSRARDHRRRRRRPCSPVRWSKVIPNLSRSWPTLSLAHHYLQAMEVFIPSYQFFHPPLTLLTS